MDYDSLLPFLKPDAESPKDLPKTIIFTNAVNTTQFISHHIHKQFMWHFQSSIDFLHAQQTVRAKNRVMKWFQHEKIRILVATEVAGMVNDKSYRINK